MGEMLLVVLANNKILKAIVMLYSVNVMNFFRTLQVSSKTFFGNEDMLKNPSVGFIPSRVPVGGHDDVPLIGYAFPCFEPRSMLGVFMHKLVSAFPASLWRNLESVILPNRVTAIHAEGLFAFVKHALAVFIYVCHRYVKECSYAV